MVLPLEIPDLDRLRRFALLIGVVLLTYAIAGIRLSQDARVAPFGLPFDVIRPELLPIGLVATSIYALVRFYYYGMLLTISPARNRKIFMEERLQGEEFDWKYVLGPSEDKKEIVNLLLLSFPTPGMRDWEFAVSEKEDEGDGPAFIKFKLRRGSRLLARIHDIDYTAPLWVNALALVAAFVFLSGDSAPPTSTKGATFLASHCGVSEGQSPDDTCTGFLLAVADRETIAGRMCPPANLTPTRMANAVKSVALRKPATQPAAAVAAEALRQTWPCRPHWDRGED